MQKTSNSLTLPVLHAAPTDAGMTRQLDGESSADLTAFPEKPIGAKQVRQTGQKTRRLISQTYDIIKISVICLTKEIIKQHDIIIN